MCYLQQVSTIEAGDTFRRSTISNVGLEGKWRRKRKLKMHSQDGEKEKMAEIKNIPEEKMNKYITVHTHRSALSS